MSNETVLLLDSDIIAYKFASANQKNFDWDNDGDIVSWTAEIEEVVPQVEQYIDELIVQLKASKVIVCLSCLKEENFRYKVLPSYKHNRADVLKPLLLSSVKDWMKENYECYERPALEADDIMGILSTHTKLVPGKKIIVSEDKDMKTIPGWLFNPRKDTKPKLITEEQADYFHLYQTLIGDTTDGYKGCPWVGPAAATRALDESPTWETVVSLYEAAVDRKTKEPLGLTEEDALVQARVARICRNTDYDFTNKEVILWTPKK